MTKIGIATVNTQIGNIDDNLRQFMRCIEVAKTQGIDLLVFPRKSLTGSGDYDFSAVPGIDPMIDECLATLAAQSDDLSVVLSYATTQGEKIAIFSKYKVLTQCSLAQRLSFDFVDRNGEAHRVILDASGAESEEEEKGILIRYDLSPFALGHRKERERRLRDYAVRHGCVVLRVCPSGTDDCRIFDGSGSLSFPDAKQYIVPPFNDFAILSANIDGSSPHLFLGNGESPDLFFQYADTFRELEDALSFALADYMKKSGHANLCLALSGGRDSVFCAILAQKALDRLRSDDDNFAGELYTAYLPSDFSGSATQVAAEKIAAACNAKHCVIPVGKLYDQTLDLLEKHAEITSDWQNDDLMLQNLQARIRSSTIWALANKYNALLITTGNMSEAAVGYSTMDGDSSGALALIAGVPKTMIIAYLHWAERYIPELSYVNSQVPTAELRPPEQKQSDEKDLMPYPVLDCLIESFIGKHTPIQSLDAVLAERFPEIPVDAIKGYRSKFLRMLTFSQWKRNRNANAFAVLDYSLHDKIGWRISSLHHNIDRLLKISQN